MTSIKERQSKIPAPTRYLAMIIAVVVAVVAIVTSFFTLGDVSWSRYVVYGAGVISLLISMIVYYYQAKP
jgi:hypothetical protein